MNIAILAKLVPDLVEELTIDSTGARLDLAFARYIINELDDHAIEQGILIKERFGGQVTVIVPEGDGADDVLFTAAAKGADRLLKLTGITPDIGSSHALARDCSEIIRELQPHLVLTGVQAHNDLDGSLGPLVAGLLELPYVGYVSGVAIQNGAASVRKEYPGGLIAEFDVTLPAVLGIQAAEQPPRYVAVSKVRQTMKTATIETRPVSTAAAAPLLTISRIYKPDVAQHATMLAGSSEEVAAQLIGILKELGVL
ncbi:MAG: electron transfer flavoprotein subunit beta [Chloroflexota bacterium]